MPPRHCPRISETSATAYRSIACRIGTHATCADASPALAPTDLPVIYETCDCPCHSAPDHSSRPAVKR
ncbi:hypothetical protein GCM10022384_53850 [Streptomyces marokkonensis]|uniref:Uncharacterized protein n=1 Tax=Streptomyces marokkonensis TaxID=324855 RepID=A0ABP7RNJ6_9ACTN